MLNLFNRSYKNVTESEVKEMMKEKNTVIIDVRESYEYASGHIKGAKLIPLGSLANRYSEIDKNKNVVVVCASGARSARAAGLLGKQGFNVSNLVGGMMRWTGSVK